MEPVRMSVAQRRTLEKAKGDIEFVEKEIAKAKKAGIPYEEAEAILNEAKRVRDGILSTYGLDARAR